MGYTYALGLQDETQQQTIDIETALHVHLTANCYPPYPVAMVGIAADAVKAFRDGEPDREIAMPDGIRYRWTPTARNIVNDLHLWAFVQSYIDPDKL